MQTAQTLVEQAKKNITEISVEEAVSKLEHDKGIKIIDVREADEFNQGHLKNAIHIPRGVLEFQIADNISELSTPIMVYCKTGGRAALSAQALQTLGYKNVASIAGGYEAWAAQDKPTTKPNANEVH